MGACSSGSRTGSAGSFLPEKISSTVDGYEINGNEVKMRSGKKVRVEEGAARPLTPEGARLLRKNNRPTDGMVEVGKAIMPENVYKAAVEQGKTQRANYEANMQKNVKGYSELTNAIEQRRSYDDQLSAAINRGVSRFKSDSGIPTTKDIESLKKKYPRATAYLKADAYSRSSNYAKAMAGERAKEKIRHGESYKKALETMEQEWKKSLHY